jgi:hypothetical protein
VPVTLTLKADAYTGAVTSITAGFGAKVVVNDNSGTAYTVDDGDTNNTIKYTAGTPVTVKYKYGSNAVAAQNLDPDFDGALIAVLSNLVATDTVKFDGNGNAEEVVFTAAPTGAGTAAKLQAVLSAVAGTAPVVTLGAATTTAITTVTIPENKTLSAVAASLTTSGAATITVDGTLIVDKDGTDKVTITNAVITAGAAESALGAAATGTVTLGAGDTLALVGSGKITTAGTGSVVAGATTIDGAGAWTASGGDVTVTASANGAALSGSSAILTASGTSATITQNAGANNALGIGAGVTLALGGSISTPATVGSIVLTEHGTDGGKITFVDTTSVILIDSADTAATALAVAAADFILVGNQASTKITVSAFANVKVHPGTTTGGKAKKITGGAAAGYLQALSSAATATSVISSSSATT